VAGGTPSRRIGAAAAGNGGDEAEVSVAGAAVPDHMAAWGTCDGRGADSSRVCAAPGSLAEPVPARLSAEEE
jgi:hypothetical protein